MKTRVVVVRGHQATPWELSQWATLPEEFDASFLLTRHNGWHLDPPPIRSRPIRTVGSVLPPGRWSRRILLHTNDRYVGLARALRDAHIVHAEELGYWFSAQVARLKRRKAIGCKLVLTTWETIPLLDTYRHHHGRLYRREVLANTDLFLAATKRAKEALLLEGVDPDRVRVCSPGIDRSRFAPRGEPRSPAAEPLILSVGRLVWEKGHQDVLRAVAALHRGMVRLPDREAARPRLLIVGSGPERERLGTLAAELGLGSSVEFREAAYGEMPELYARASCLALASLPAALKPYHLFDRPRIFWEEQFGMVLAEAMAAGLPIVASRSGAIPEVVPEQVRLVNSGDWAELASALAAGVLAGRAGRRIRYPEELLDHYSLEAVGQRLADAYRAVLDLP
jgi:glycosyltransferase involved in cell wall biosynthesis